MRVLHVLPTLEVGGAETALLRLVEEWQRQGGMDVHVAAFAGGPRADGLRDAGARVHLLAGPVVLAPVRLARIIADIRPDVIQTWMYRADLAGTLASMGRTRAPVIWNLRCSAEWRRARAGRWLVFALLRALSARPWCIVANSRRAIAEHRAAGYHPRCWRFLPNGFDVARFGPDAQARARVRAQTGVAPDAPLVGMIGRFDHLKGHATFVAAARAIVEHCPAAHFLIAGTGVPEGVRTLFADGKIPAHFVLLDRRDDVAALMNALDVLLLPSLSEGFPNVLGEAMACALPSVATAVGDVPMLLDDSARVVPPADPAALAQACLRLLALSAQERQAIGARDRAIIADGYGIDVVARRYADMYREAAGIGQPEGCP